PGQDTSSSRGNINYRSMRKVKVVPATQTSSGEKDCSKGGEQPCSDESKFTSAQDSAKPLLEKAIGILKERDKGNQLTVQAKTLLENHFHASDDDSRTMAASVVLDNLQKVEEHILIQMKPVGTKGVSEDKRVPGHVCANECDASCGEPTVA